MSEKSIFESQDRRIALLEAKVEKANDSIKTLQNTIGNLNYFTLLGNDNAMTYFENMGYEAADVEAKVSDQIYDFNLQKGNNPLVPFDGMVGDMKINKLKFLNHKWILADFTDGKYWGEMILAFSFNKNNDLELTTIGSLLYPQ